MKPMLKLAVFTIVGALAACGTGQSSGPRSVTAVTVTVTAPQPAPATSQQTAPPASTIPPAATRTGPSPAFTRTTPAPADADLQAAMAKVGSLGFTPLSTATYDRGQTLRVLVGARTSSSDAHAQQAFFFDGTRYLGTDAKVPSGRITVAAHDDTDVTLRYAIYDPADPACCPTGVAQTVRFGLDGGHLVALDPIPSAAARR